MLLRVINFICKTICIYFTGYRPGWWCSSVADPFLLIVAVSGPSWDKFKSSICPFMSTCHAKQNKTN